MWEDRGSGESEVLWGVEEDGYGINIATLSDMDEFVQKSGQVLEDGVEEAKAGFKVAVEGLKAAAAVAEFVK